jgi:hypothetical protein
MGAKFSQQRFFANVSRNPWQAQVKKALSAKPFGRFLFAKFSRKGAKALNSDAFSSLAKALSH